MKMARKPIYASKAVLFDAADAPIGVEFHFKSIGHRLRLMLADVMDPDVIELIPTGVRQAICHGWKRKVGDSYGSDPECGSAADAHEIARAEIERLVDNGWNEKTRTAVPLGLLFRAIAEMRGLDVEAVRGTWEGNPAEGIPGLPEEKRAALRDVKTPSGMAIKAKADEIRARERLARTEDDSGLEDIFGAEDG